jgi:hypothetical protein
MVIIHCYSFHQPHPQPEIWLIGWSGGGGSKSDLFVMAELRKKRKGGGGGVSHQRVSLGIIVDIWRERSKKGLAARGPGQPPPPPARPPAARRRPNLFRRPRPTSRR